MPAETLALWHSDFRYATHRPSGLTIGDAPMPPPTITCASEPSAFACTSAGDAEHGSVRASSCV